MSTFKDKQPQFFGSIRDRLKNMAKPTANPTQPNSGPSAPTALPGSSEPFEQTSLQAITPSQPRYASANSTAPSLASTPDPAPIAMSDTPVLSNDESRRLRCVIERESVVFTVTVPRDFEVGDLKKEIQRERALDTLKGVGPHTLELWKVSAVDESRCEVTWLSSLPFQPKDSNPIAVKPSDSLPEHVEPLGDSLADKLEPTDSLRIIFPIQPPSECIHIIVRKAKATGE